MSEIEKANLSSRKVARLEPKEEIVKDETIWVRQFDLMGYQEVMSEWQPADYNSMRTYEKWLGYHPNNPTEFIEDWKEVDRGHRTFIPTALP